MGQPKHLHTTVRDEKPSSSSRRDDRCPKETASQETTPRRQRSPGQQPRNSHSNEQMYILTLLTDAKLHTAMNDLRKKYFPQELNKLEAHITLFHALPESQLDNKVMPAIEDLVCKTNPFKLGATTPFKLKKGIAIGLPEDHGGNDTRSIHRSLVQQWQDFLSQQDQSFQAHFTVMNKVDDSKMVDLAFSEIQDGWKPCFGTAEGLSLWKYNAGHWSFVKNLPFNTSSS